MNNTEQEPLGKINLTPLKGLSALSADEQGTWINQQIEAGLLPKRWSMSQAEQLYRNGQYIKEFGLDTFKANQNPEERDSQFRSKIINDNFDSYYGEDKGLYAFDVINRLTDEGKLDLMESGFLNQKDYENHLKESYDEYTESMKATARLDSGAITRWDTPDKWVSDRNKIRQNQFAKILTEDNERKVADSTKDINALVEIYTNGQNTWGELNNLFNSAINNEVPLEEVTSQMYKTGFITKSQADRLNNLPVEQKVNTIGEILQTHEFNPARIDTLFDQVAKPREVEYTDAFGHTEKAALPGSNAYIQLGGSDRFKDFKEGDKLREYLTWQVLANKYGMPDAISNLETSMMTYADNHEGYKEFVTDVALNVTLGGIANIMNKVNGIGNIYTDIEGAIKGDKEALANKLMGLKEDGSEREQKENAGAFRWMWDNAFNPAYWEKVDQYNTLDPFAIAAADAHGGISPYVDIVPPSESLKFFSSNTLKEALKMAKFAWSDYLTGKLFGVVSGSLGKVGAIANVGLSSLGIAESYGVMTFDSTYQDEMDKSDKAISAKADDYIDNYQYSDEDKAIIDRVTRERIAYQDQVTRGQENAIKLSDEEIRSEVEKEYNDHLKRQWLETEGAELRKQDEKIAKRVAANAYRIDATIEEIAMAANNFSFRRYLFDRGTLKALGANMDYAKVVPTTEGTLGMASRFRNVALPVAKTFYGGFHSNYFDDVRVAFSKGFALGQYNNYLEDKYSPEKVKNTADYSISFLDGITGAIQEGQEALFDRQSWYDGTIGALGTLTSATIRTPGDRAATMKEMGVTSTDELNLLQRINIAVANPLLSEYYRAVAKEENTAKMLPTVNKVLSENRADLENIVQVVGNLQSVEAANLSESANIRKDAKERQSFQLLYNLLGNESSGILAQSDLVRDAIQTIDRLAKGDISDVEVNDFVAQHPEVRNEDNPTQAARERIQKNAEEMQAMAKGISEAKEYISSSVQTRDPDDVEQQVYMLAMDTSWKDRANDMEEQLTGKELYPQKKTFKERISSLFNPNKSNINPVARYGNLENLENNINKEKERAKELSFERAATSRALTAEANRLKALREDPAATKEQIEESNRRYQALLVNHNQQQAESREIARNLSKMRGYTKAFEGETTVLSEQDIMNLNPKDRAAILDEKNRKYYSEEQQEIIDNTRKSLELMGDNYLSMVEDVATLADRIDDNRNSFEIIKKNPEAASYYAKTLRDARSESLRQVLEDVKANDTISNIKDILSDEAETVESKSMRLKNYFFGVNGTTTPYSKLTDFIKEYPEETDRYRGIFDTYKAWDTIQSIIDNTFGDPLNRAALRVTIGDIAKTSNNVEEFLSDLENFTNEEGSVVVPLEATEEQIKQAEEGQRNTQRAVGQILEKYKSMTSLEESTTNRSKAEEKKAKVEAQKKEEAREEKAEAPEEKKPEPQPINDEISSEPEVEEIPEPIGNAKDALLVGVEDVVFDLGTNGEVQSPSAEQQAAAAGTTVITAEQAPVEDISQMATQEDVLPGNKWVEYSVEALSEGKVALEIPKSDKSIFGRFRDFLDNHQIKLQEIIDNEFGKVLQDNPEVPIRFMLLKQDSGNGDLSKVLFNVIEYTDAVAKYHQEDRGGVIQADGKSWLIVGTTGYFESGSVAQRSAYNNTYAPISRGRAEYFNGNTSEQYYVDQNVYTIVQNTTSGRLVNQALGQSESSLKSVGELLKSEGKSLKDAQFGIQTRESGDGFVVTSNAVKEQREGKIFGPRNIEDNRGRAFLLVETPNGYKIPGMIEPVMFNNLQDGSPLKDMILSTITRLFDRNYSIREAAIRELCGYLVLNSEDKNILIGTEKTPTITITRKGVSNITQELGPKFDRVKFMEDLANANFQVNVTIQTLNNPVKLEMYDNSGALQTTLASSKAVGMGYTVYATDSFGKPIIMTPIGNAVPGTGTPKIKQYNSVRVNNTTYTKENGVFYDKTTNKPVDPSSALGISCTYNEIIRDSRQTPVYTKNGLEYYDLGGPRIIIRDGLGNIRSLTDEKSAEFRRRLSNKIAEEQRINNLEDVNLEDPTPQPKTSTEVVTLEQAAMQAVDGFNNPSETSVQQSETKVEIKEVPSEKPKEVIASIGKKSLAELQNTENLSTFAQVATSREYRKELYSALREKGWGVTGDLKSDAEILKKHNVSVEGITNVRDWIDLIKNCK